MRTYDKQEQQKEQGRILARRLARELTKEELNAVAGGMRANSSSAWSCSGAGDGDDGGADD